MELTVTVRVKVEPAQGLEYTREFLEEAHFLQVDPTPQMGG